MGVAPRVAISSLLCGSDRKSTRLNSSHGYISYAVFCLKKKTEMPTPNTTMSSIKNELPKSGLVGPLLRSPPEKLTDVLVRRAVDVWPVSHSVIMLGCHKRDRYGGGHKAVKAARPGSELQRILASE